ncbi:hypothetical protein K8R78_02025 [bacterium]|nr:hypothetical protein [bacterium]
MIGTDLTQKEADTLIKMEKHRIDETGYEFPLQGGSLVVPLQSMYRHEQFLLDIRRGKIDSLKVTMQNRARGSIVLLRLDLSGSPHRNPDGEELPCPHLHVYREGYGDKYAIPIPNENFPRINSLWGTFEDFMKYCNITKIPNIERGVLI